MALFERGVAHLRNRLQQSSAIDIVYHRVSNSTITASITLTGVAWVGRTQFRIAKKDKSTLYYSDRDFLVPVALLIQSTTLFEPAKGDIIEQVLPDPVGNQKYVVIAPEDEPPWRHSDPQKLIYRIHTKRMVV